MSVPHLCLRPTVCPSPLSRAHCVSVPHLCLGPTVCLSLTSVSGPLCVPHLCLGPTVCLSLTSVSGPLCVCPSPLSRAHCVSVPHLCLGPTVCLSLTSVSGPLCVCPPPLSPAHCVSVPDLCLGLTVCPSPLSCAHAQVFTADAMLKYLRMFNFLWRGKRMEYCLANMWREQIANNRKLQTIKGIHNVLITCHTLSLDSRPILTN